MRKTTPIGLDLGQTSSRAAQLTRAGSRWLVTGAVACESEDVDYLDLGRIGRLTARSRFRSRMASVALSSPELHFHLLELPAAALAIGEGGTRASPVVQNEMERLTSGAVSPAETRHWGLPNPGPNSPNAMGVALARPLAERVVLSAEGAGVRCARLTTAPTALVTLAKYLNDWPRERVWGVLDVGLRESRLILCVDGTPVLIRRAGAGGRELTERVAQSLNLSPKAAEVHKCEHGIAAPTGGKMRDEARRSELPSLVIGAVRADLTEVAAEIKRSYEYVLRCYPGKVAGDLVLTGGGALMKNLPAFFSQVLGIRVRAASSYLEEQQCRIQVEPGVRAPVEIFAVALGAALETCDGA
jgi:Tfp pilus assembly PilM family ATPase